MEQVEEQIYPSVDNIIPIEFPSVKEIELIIEQLESDNIEPIEIPSVKEIEIDNTEFIEIPSVKEIKIDNTEPIEIPSVKEEIDIKLLKDKAQKVKVIALELLDKPIFSNPSQFTNRERDKVLRIMKEWFNKSDEIVNQYFNEIVLDQIDINYEKIYINPKNITYAPDPEFHKNLPPMDIV